MRTIEDLNNEISMLRDRLSEVKGRETEVYTRIVGYYRSIKNWNKGKREEYNYRQPFSLPADAGKAPAANSAKAVKLAKTASVSEHVACL
ncbi:MAG: hypothetical protein JW881_15335 [Spirochaetales bacterium]|nr:hypothetical protein [Spirochaetales bacterium]